VRTWLRRRRLALVTAIVLALFVAGGLLLLAAPGAETGAGKSAPADKRRPAPELEGTWLVPPPVPPETYYPDATGRIVGQLPGAISRATLEQAIAEALGGSAR
jgi:hypothetical protein